MISTDFYLLVWWWFLYNKDRYYYCSKWNCCLNWQ